MEPATASRKQLVYCITYTLNSNDAFDLLGETVVHNLEVAVGANQQILRLQISDGRKLVVFIATRLTVYSTGGTDSRTP